MTDIASKPYVLYVGFFQRPSTKEFAPYFVTTAPGFNVENDGGFQVRIEIDADKLNALFASAGIPTFSGNVTAVDE